MIYEIGFEVKVKNDHFDEGEKVLIKTFQIYSLDLSDAVKKGFNYVMTYCLNNYQNFNIVTFAAEEVNNYGN